jgi:glyoxylase-like metal-dependent hydrolase (beta-lactamase superfamily II)
MRIHTYTAAETGLLVNSYLLETDHGVVAIDTNLLISDIDALNARLAALKKPLLAIFVTHAHPDHFNGVMELVRVREVPVYATLGVDKKIREIAEAKRAQWAPVYGSEWPSETFYPSVALVNRQVVDVDGLSITAREMGEAESHADSYFTVQEGDEPPIAFTGDLGFNGTHPYSADGHTTAWLLALDVLTRELAGVQHILPGHGAPTNMSLFDDQRRYLLYYREVVGRLAAGAPTLTDDAQVALEGAMQQFLPNAPLTWMIGLGANAVATEIARERMVHA